VIVFRGNFVRKFKLMDHQNMRPEKKVREVLCCNVF
jgi:hypothetical protein